MCNNCTVFLTIGGSRPTPNANAHNNALDKLGCKQLRFPSFVPYSSNMLALGTKGLSPHSYRSPLVSNCTSSIREHGGVFTFGVNKAASTVTLILTLWACGCKQLEFHFFRPIDRQYFAALVQVCEQFRAFRSWHKRNSRSPTKQSNRVNCLP